MKLLQRKLGHKDIKTTLNTYVDDDLKLQRRKVEDLVKLLRDKIC